MDFVKEKLTIPSCRYIITLYKIFSKNAIVSLCKVSIEHPGWACFKHMGGRIEPWNVIGRRTLKNVTVPMSPAPEKGSVASVLPII